MNNSKISTELRNQLCLNDEHLLKLCEIGIYLEKRYQTPRDIEWAIHKVCFHAFIPSGKTISTMFVEL